MQGSREDAFQTATIVQRATLRPEDAIELAWIRTIIWPIRGNDVHMAMAKLRGQRLADLVITENYASYRRRLGDKEALERWYSDRLKQYLRYRANLE